MAERKISGFTELAKEQQLQPQESLVKVQKRINQLRIGVPKEHSLQENRVSLKPESVEVICGNEHQITIEAGAGESAHFRDDEYSEMGAIISQSRKEVFESDIVLKIEPPTMEELELMRPGTTLISALQTGGQTGDFLQALNKKRITAIGYEFLEDLAGGLPVVRAMSEIAGSTVLIIAGEYLSSPNNGQGVILGGITGVPPTKVVILGAGTVAEYAARAAIGLGLDIRVFDNHIFKLRRLKHALGQPVYTSTIDHLTLGRSLKEADVVIGALRPEDGMPICVVSEDMVKDMKPGAVIVDVSIDQGGCVATSTVTSHDRPVFRVHGVIHYCVPNIASRVARSASLAISNIFTPILLQVGKEGGIDEMIYKQRWFMKGVYTYRGSLTNLELAKRFNLGYKDLNLLMAARF